MFAMLSAMGLLIMSIAKKNRCCHYIKTQRLCDCAAIMYSGLFTGIKKADPDAGSAFAYRM
jgi:hypothetical protein